jgi:hypothetical protein
MTLGLGRAEARNDELDRKVRELDARPPAFSDEAAEMWP